MGWSERKRVLPRTTTHEKGGVTKEDCAVSCSQRHSKLAQLVGVTRRWGCNISPSWLPGVMSGSGPDLVRSLDRQPEPHRSKFIPDGSDTHVIHTVTPNLL